MSYKDYKNLALKDSYAEYGIRRDRHHKYFMSVMEELMKRYKEALKKNDKDRDFLMWHVVKDAYEEGFAYFRAELFDLTDAQDFFRDVVRDEI